VIHRAALSISLSLSLSVSLSKDPRHREQRQAAGVMSVPCLPAVMGVARCSSPRGVGSPVLDPATRARANARQAASHTQTASPHELMVS